MTIVNFLQSSSGRLVRALVGLILVLVGFLWIGGGWGMLIVIVGIVPIAMAALFGAKISQRACGRLPAGS